MKERITLDPELLASLPLLLEKSKLTSLCDRHGIDPLLLRQSTIVLLHELGKLGYLAQSGPGGTVRATSTARGQTPARPTDDDQLRYLRVSQIFARFRELDHKRLFTPLDRKEEASWHTCHNLLVSDLFSEPYSSLLDKRSSIRVPIDLEVRYRLFLSVRHTRAVNLGTGGLCLLLEPKVRLGQNLKLHVVLGGQHLRIPATILWKDHRSGTMALRFHNVDTDTKVRLSEEVHRIIAHHLG